jgi:serine/threonine protein kinase
MNPTDDTPDDALVDLLAANADTPGGPADGTADPDDPALRRRLDAARDCLRRLDRIWPRPSASGEVTARLRDGARRSPPPPANEPVMIGRFRVVRQLGRGGFGVVYLAEDPRLGRQVALKVPRPEVVLTPELRLRFLREARAAARLSHPHILPVFEPGEVGPFCYFVASYCAGGSLAAWLATHPQPMPARAAAALTAALAGAVQHAHEQGILHRDLKPANVLLEPLGDREAGPWEGFPFRPQVGDFGLAKFFEAAEEGSDPAPGAGTDLRPTLTLAPLGTPAYMAPEQAEGRRGAIGPAVDVYGLGAILYELLTGRPPFRGDSALDTLRLVATEEPTPPRRLRRDVPRDLEAICLKCLEKQPARRYASAAELAADLQRFQEDRPTRARPVGAWSRAVGWCRRHRALAALLAVVALSSVALAGGLYLHDRRLRAYDGAL